MQCLVLVWPYKSIVILLTLFEIAFYGLSLNVAEINQVTRLLRSFYLPIYMIGMALAF
jgi:hypothetical protein